MILCDLSCVFPRGHMQLSFEDAVLLTQIRLRYAFTFKHLGYLFGLSEDTASRYFHTLLCMLSHMFDKTELFQHSTPESVMEANKASLPCFLPFRNCVLVLDCTEFFIETPGTTDVHKCTFSDYKNHHTIKVLVGIDVQGRVVYVSTCKPGRISDKRIVVTTKVLLDMVPQQRKLAVMVDKGFPISKIAEAMGIEIIIPPYASKHRAFTEDETQLACLIAQARIHVERAILRAKKFQILAGEIPCSSLPYISMVVKVVFLMTNLMGEIVLDRE
jgi:DDE superfamily endonuclease/Helix-turn-helix of DDE superfamily endonuclease